MVEANYGVMSLPTDDPKQLAILLLKRIILNNKNAINFLESNITIEAEKRLINSIHILEELDLMLNREEENPVVFRVSNHYQWMMEIYEGILEKSEEDRLNLNKNEYIENICSTDTTLQNLLEGFSGMRD